MYKTNASFKNIKLNLIGVVFLLSGCTSDEVDIVSQSQSIQYSFEIEFGGEIHRIEGGFSDYFEFSQSTIQNHSLASLSQGYLSLGLQLNDINSADYISGQSLYINLLIENPQIGNNNTGVLQINSRPYTDYYADSNNLSATHFWTSQYVENTSMSYTDAYNSDLIGKLTTIRLSNLGTSPSIGTANGENVHGSYEGVLYFRQQGQVTTDPLFDTPVPLKITFSAVRMN